MNVVVVMFRRTVAKLLCSFTGLGAIALFASLASASFIAALERGGAVSVPGLWAVAAAKFLPVLAAFLTMGLVAEERLAGRLDLLLAAPVRERDVVFGKFLGAWCGTAAALVLYLTTPLLLLPRFAPSFSPELQWIAFLPAFVTLLMQSALWTAIGLFSSACFRQPATAAVASIVATIVAPLGAWRAGCEFSPALRAGFPDYPVFARAYDLSTGLVSLEDVVFYAVFVWVALFAASKAVAFGRMAGRGARMLRTSTVISIVLGFMFAGLLSALVHRVDVTVNFAALRAKPDEVSARTRQLISGLDGETRVTCFLSSRSPEFRPVRRLLRSLAAVAEEHSGARLVVDAVDPRWDLAAAARLVREGVSEGSLVFQRGHRRETIPAKTADEPSCASALLRLALPARRETIYWTTGHGETSFDSHDETYGMSDITRDLRRDGYLIKALDVSEAPSLPADCALLVVAGAREAFSREEMQRVDGYLRHGGRMLVLASPRANAGVAGLLLRWGLKTLSFTAVSPRTVNGADLAVTDLGDHVITRPLAGTTLLFGFAAPIVSALPENAVDKDGIVFTPLAMTDARAWGEADMSVRPWTFDAETEPAGPLVLAAALERGAQAEANLAFRPTRIVVVGDAAFALNGALASRANANRDFMLNAFAWLAGLDASMAPGTPGDVIVTGLERSGWVRLALAACILMPLLPFLCPVLAALKRHRMAKRGGAGQ